VKKPFKGSGRVRRQSERYARLRELRVLLPGREKIQI
jgi:hypothetical protein